MPRLSATRRQRRWAPSGRRKRASGSRILKAAGLTDADIRNIRFEQDLIAAIGARSGETTIEKVLTAQTEIAVKAAIEAPARAVHKFSRNLARLMFADDADER
jgi:hypothetical protein